MLTSCLCGDAIKLITIIPVLNFNQLAIFKPKNLNKPVWAKVIKPFVNGNFDFTKDGLSELSLIIIRVTMDTSDPVFFPDAFFAQHPVKQSSSQKNIPD